MLLFAPLAAAGDASKAPTVSEQRRALTPEESNRISAEMKKRETHAGDAEAPPEEEAELEPGPSSEEEPDTDSYSPPADAASSTPGFLSGLQLSGYVDLGFAAVGGDGTSYPEGDVRIPADYGVDPFAPAVNSRGDVASTDSKGRFANGVLPRSMGMGGGASFFINTINLDLKYEPGNAPLLFFTRLQVLPRFVVGTDTRVVADQAFARIIPFSSQDLMLWVGKFDPVFGIEYLENQAPLRTGITPSLVARYTTGQVLGVKAFYRFQLPSLWSAISFNVSATNGSSLVESLQPQEVSLTGAPVLSGRLGYELNTPKTQLKIGASGMAGPRNDQHRRDVRQWAFGLDARASIGCLALTGEFVRAQQNEGDGDKLDGLGAQTAVSGFNARGGYLTASYCVPFESGALNKLTVYGRYDRRHAQFEGFSRLATDRFTAGLRGDFWESLVIKMEILLNRELWGAPQVDNNVFTSSLIYVF
jgi:hypothetical protein